MTMRVLVTGHVGFVGRYLVRALTDRDVIGMDVLDTPPCDIVTDELPDDVDRVYHLAAQTNAQSTEAANDALVNVFGTVRLLEKYGSRVVLASSSMVNYPVCPYAVSKRACEEYAKMYGAAIVRFPNLYGEGGHSVIDRFFNDEELVIRGTGEQLRTYAHVSSAVRAMLMVHHGETYIVRGLDRTVNQLAARHPHKRVRRESSSPMDIEKAIQI